MFKFLIFLFFLSSIFSEESCGDVALLDSAAASPVLASTKGILGYISNNGFEIKTEKEKEYWELKSALYRLSARGIQEAYNLLYEIHSEIAENLEKELELKKGSLGGFSRTIKLRF